MRGCARIAVQRTVLGAGPTCASTYAGGGLALLAGLAIARAIVRWAIAARPDSPRSAAGPRRRDCWRWTRHSRARRRLGRRDLTVREVRQRSPRRRAEVNPDVRRRWYQGAGLDIERRRRSPRNRDRVAGTPHERRSRARTRARDLSRLQSATLGEFLNDPSHFRWNRVRSANGFIRGKHGGCIKCTRRESLPC